MTRNELIAQVALRMDEITPGTAINVTVDGADNNPLYALIDGIADDCAIELYSFAPYWRLPQTAFPAANIIVEAIPNDPDERKYIRLKLPDDFLRVAEIDSVYFLRPITEVVPEQAPEGKKQHNRFLMGKEAKPVGVLSHGVWSSQQCREIDCYSLDKDAVVSAQSGLSASYIAKPASAQTVMSLLIPALEWLIASKAFGARGDEPHARICQLTAQSLLI